MNFNSYISIGAAYGVERDLDNAIVNFERGLAENRQAIWAYRELIPAYLAAGRIKDAERGVSLLLQTYPELTAAKVRVAMVFPESEMNWICENLIAAGLPK
jgi:hypothetical protein